MGEPVARPPRVAPTATSSEPTTRGAKVLHGVSPRRITGMLGALVTPRRSPPTATPSRLGDNLIQRLRRVRQDPCGTTRWRVVNENGRQRIQRSAPAAGGA